jgi:carbonic anhydrase
MRTLHNPIRSSLSIAGLFLVVLFGGLIFSGCGKADATEKKDKKGKKTAKNEKSNGKASETDQSDNSSTTNEEDADEHSKDGEETKANHKKDEKTVKHAEKGRAPDAIWADLVNGNKRFMAGKHTAVNYSSVRQKLAKGQKPEVIVLGCADSRVPPEFVFDKNLGELFVIRDAGNIADKMALGSIEYAVEHLHSRILVVLGHESCGAVAAAVSGEKMPSPNLRAIVESISPSFEGSSTCRIGSESNLSCVELNVRHSAGDILTRSPIIKKAVDEGELTIVHAVYKMETGAVIRLD